jgi:hypothetical protein
VVVAAIRRAAADWRVRIEVANFDRTFRRYGDPLVARFGDELAPVMRKEILAEYRRLVPGIPDIGGRRNPYTPVLRSAGARPLAVHRVVLRHGGTAEDTGWMFHHLLRTGLDRVPRVLRHWIGQRRPAGRSPKQWEKMVRRSQARRYPGDWVFENLERDEGSFDFGMDVTECGALQYLHAHGADELTPYICDLDRVAAEMMGYRLTRTKTLAWGCDRCDFRISLQGETTAPWPPEFLERTCGRADTAGSNQTAAQTRAAQGTGDR